MNTLGVTVFLLAAALSASGAGLQNRLQRLGSERPVPPIEPFSDTLHVESGVRIYGGEDADPSDAPYQAALFDEKKGFFCAASIISENWIITAGHCVDWTVRDIEVSVGSVFLQQAATDPQPQKITTTPSDRTLHENFDMDYLDNDIALIKLPSSITFETDTIEAIQLPKYADAVKNVNSLRVTVTGWGRTSDGQGPATNNALQKASLILSEDSVCEKVYGNSFLGTKLCASTSQDSTCTGDSGGPVMFEEKRKYFLYGIISFGHKDGCAKGQPVVFTRVTSFLEFIETTTGLKISDN